MTGSCRGFAHADHAFAPRRCVGAVAEDALDRLEIEVVSAAVVGQNKEAGPLLRADLVVEIVKGLGDGGNARVAGEQHVLVVDHEAHDGGAVVAGITNFVTIRRCKNNGNMPHVRQSLMQNPTVIPIRKVSILGDDAQIFDFQS